MKIMQTPVTHLKKHEINAQCFSNLQVYVCEI